MASVELITLLCLFSLGYLKASDVPSVGWKDACSAGGIQDVQERLFLLSSPGFDNFHYYPPNMDCNWRMRALPGQAWVVRRLFFGLNAECGPDDFVWLGEGDPPRELGRFCGYWAPSRLKTRDALLTVRFRSGRTPRNVGFHFYLRQEPRDVACTDEEVTCRNGYECVTHEKKCDGQADCDDGTDEEDCHDQPAWNVSSCGRSVLPPAGVWHVVGGEEAASGSWPWQASLRLPSLEPNSHYCGAVLVHPRWLLTAGHCFKSDRLDVQLWEVMLGKHQKILPEDTEQRRYMQEIILHPLYQGLNETRLSVPWLIRKQHDLALVRLNAPITLTPWVSPVCLPEKEPPPGTPCVVTGWGETYGTGYEMELKQATVPVVSLEQCRKWHRFLDVAPTMICAGTEQGGQDSCQGDSGGPLVFSEDGHRWQLAGIVSTGGSICAAEKQPGIYTNVHFYQDWIRETLRNHSDFL